MGSVSKPINLVKILEEKRFRRKTSLPLLVALWQIHVTQPATVARGDKARAFLYALAFHLEFDYRTADQFVIYMIEQLSPSALSIPESASSTTAAAAATSSPLQMPRRARSISFTQPEKPSTPGSNEIEVDFGALSKWFEEIHSRHDNQLASERHPPLEGWLYKRGRVMTNWKHRFCVLLDGTLSYFKEKSEKKPVGVVTITDSVINYIEPSTGISCSRARYCFSVWTPDRIFYFATQDKEEMVEWMKALMKHSVPTQAVSNPFPSVVPKPTPSILRSRGARRTGNEGTPSANLDESDLFAIAEARIEISSLETYPRDR